MVLMYCDGILFIGFGELNVKCIVAIVRVLIAEVVIFSPKSTLEPFSSDSLAG